MLELVASNISPNQKYAQSLISHLSCAVAGVTALVATQELRKCTERHHKPNKSYSRTCLTIYILMLQST